MMLRDEARMKTHIAVFVLVAWVINFLAAILAWLPMYYFSYEESSAINAIVFVIAAITLYFLSVKIFGVLAKLFGIHGNWDEQRFVITFENILVGLFLFMPPIICFWSFVKYFKSSAHFSINDTFPVLLVLAIIEFLMTFWSNFLDHYSER